MSQFILVNGVVSSDGVHFRPLHDSLRSVAVEQFGRSEDCLLVTDAHGRGEPLVDAVWTAQSAGEAIESTPLMRWMRAVVD